MIRKVPQILHINCKFQGEALVTDSQVHCRTTRNVTVSHQEVMRTAFQFSPTKFVEKMTVQVE